MSFLENDFFDQDGNLDVYGADEVGRGPLAGPVVCSGVHLKGSGSNTLKSLEYLKSLEVTDSKKIKEKKRKAILEELDIDWVNLKTQKKYKKDIFGLELNFCLVELSPILIDEMNIPAASLQGMGSAVKSLSKQSLANCHIWFDGNKVPHEFSDDSRAQGVVKGDQKSASIALASILAKTYRDEIMKKESLKYPEYGFEKHAGYPTVTHIGAIKKFGPCPIHRFTFKRVKEHVTETHLRQRRET